MPDWRKQKCNQLHYFCPPLLHGQEWLKRGFSLAKNARTPSLQSCEVKAFSLKGSEA
jgi:hypothetical protein